MSSGSELRLAAQRDYRRGIDDDDVPSTRASWVAIGDCRSLRAKLPRLIHQVCMNGLGIVGGKNVVPTTHPLSLVNSLEHDLVEQLMGHRRDLPQIRQQRSTERVTSS